MIDLHNHILPGVDDGAHDLDEALAMAEQAVAAGTTILAATPHRFWRGKDLTTEFIAWHVERLQGELDRRSIGLRLVAGCEIPIHSDPLERIASGLLPKLGGKDGKAVLIEPPFDRIPANSIRLLHALRERELVPVLAHPERNSEIQNDPAAFLDACVQAGAVLQVTSGSLLGHFGRDARQAAHAIVTRPDWPVIIASDAHWDHDRTPSDLGTARDMAAMWLGDQALACRMVEDLPASLIGM